MNDLFNHVKLTLKIASNVQPVYRDFRVGDIRHSLADISKAKEKLGYRPEYKVFDGLNESMIWYKKFFNKS